MKGLKKVVKFILLIIAGLALIYFTTFVIRKIRVENNKKIITAHFNINYNGVLKTEANDISKALEANYDRIRKELNDPEHSKISVFVHSTQKDFNKATGLINSKANGTSRGPLAFHLKYETWYNSVFPQNMSKVAVHEFTHCVQLNVLIQDALSKTTSEKTASFDKDFEEKFLKEYPQWLWEALSDYEAGMVNKASVKHGMKNKPTLQQLNNSNQVYNVGYTIIEYLVSNYGKEKLPLFVKSYGNFEEVLGVSEKDFESGWYKFVDEKYL
jgi:hypothetical protein